ncbi:hypothetical protein C8J56DRAFT_960877 [Mycena floridula]|nr:hypothetical protein C8J56DRAFT_960877 [Mycena floridula]
MRFTQLSSLFLFGLTFSFVSTTPTPNTVAKRQTDASVTDILSTLQGSVNSVLPQICKGYISSPRFGFDIPCSDSCQQRNCKRRNCRPLVDQLTSALGLATTSLSQVNGADESSAQTSALVLPIVSNIANGVAPLQGHVKPERFHGLDFALAALLKGLEGVIAGVLKLLAILLFDVAIVLKKLAFTLTLAALRL